MKKAMFLCACLATCALAGRAAAQGDPPATAAPVPVPAPPPPAPPEPPKPATAQPETVKITPYASIVGGAKVDTIIQSPQEQREGRVSALAITDFGVRGQIADWLWFESELMANGGTDLHGASAWEGQAAMQVRQQVIRARQGDFTGEVGRLLDPASVDYFSAHVADTFLQDTAVRDPLLYSGLNLGNGLRGAYEPTKGLVLGLTFTAGNPVSNTASLQVGGSFPPFDRFYIQPYQQVKQQPNNYPDDTFHMMLLAPAIMYTNDFVDAHAELQGYVVDTNTNRTDDQNLKGYDARAGIKLKLLDDALSPFFNVALDRNDTVVPTNVSQLAVDKYTAIVYGGGVDANFSHRAPDRPNGIGAQYERVQYQVGNGNVTNLHYVNVGATYWLARNVAAGARFAMWIRTDVGVHDEGERSLILTLRTVF
jgi:hypothetical protein